MMRMFEVALSPQRGSNMPAPLGQGFQGVKCRKITPVAELARVRTIGHSIRILANSATSVGKPHLGSPAPKGLSLIAQGCPPKAGYPGLARYRPFYPEGVASSET